MRSRKGYPMILKKRIHSEIGKELRTEEK